MMFSFMRYFKKSKKLKMKKVKIKSITYPIFGGGATQLLKQYRQQILKNAFEVAKRFRQFYLSRPYFKSILFNLIGKKERALILKNQVVLNCAPVLHLKINHLKHSYALYLNFKQFYSKSLEWLNSKEFNENYKNHPFAPLLNPVNVPYQKIMPQLAWDLNLPLPENYDFIFLSCHGVGRAATGSYFLSCNVPYFNEFQTFWDSKSRYCAFYQILLSKEYQNAHNMIHLSELRMEQNKLAHLLKKRPFLMLVRDPISNLRSLINYNHFSNTKIFSLNDFDFQILGKYVSKRVLNNESILTWLRWVLEPFAENAFFDLIENEAVIIQTEDVLPKNAFETFKNLALFFKFDAPKENQRALFETNMVQGMLDTCMPLILRIDAADLTKNNQNNNFDYFDIYITYSLGWNLTKERNKIFKDISFVFNVEQNTISDCCIQIEEKDVLFLEYLKNDIVLIQKIKNYIESLLKSLKQQNEIYKRFYYTEEDILEFLSYSQECRKKVKAHLDLRVAYFKKNRPDIIQSWQYYLQFEKMCEELN